MAKRPLEIAKPTAKDRQKEGGRKGSSSERSGTLPEAPEQRARDKAGEALGVSGKAAERAAAVVEPAEEGPEGVGDLMDAWTNWGRRRQKPSSLIMG